MRKRNVDWIEDDLESGHYHHEVAEVYCSILSPRSSTWHHQRLFSPKIEPLYIHIHVRVAMKALNRLQVHSIEGKITDFHTWTPSLEYTVKKSRDVCCDEWIENWASSVEIWLRTSISEHSRFAYSLFTYESVFTAVTTTSHVSVQFSTRCSSRQE